MSAFFPPLLLLCAPSTFHSALPCPSAPAPSCFPLTPGTNRNTPTPELNNRSAGAMLRDLTVTGCGAAAVEVLPDPALPRYPEGRPVALRGVTLEANAGAALSMGNGTAAALDRCRVARNRGAGGAVVARAGALLNLTDSVFASNARGPAVNFTGVRLIARGCNFTDNAAREGAGVWAAFVDPPASLYATEGTGTVVPPSGTVTLERCCFERNNATGAGGGLLVGARVAAFARGCRFEANAAAEGGGAAAARDGCLEELRDTAFVANTAAGLGGGLLTRAPLCTKSNMTWARLTVASNTAGGDGGGAYVSEVAFRWLRVTGGGFSGNTARGAAPRGRSGDGGALYLGTWSSRAWLDGVRFDGNEAARSGGAVHAILLSQDGLVDLTVSNVTAAANAAGAPGAAGAAAEGGALRVLGSLPAVVVAASAFEGNEAGQGGAISFGADRGSLTVVNGTRFVDNAAAVAGGALLAGEGVDLTVANSTFEGNRAGAVDADGVALTSSAPAAAAAALAADGGYGAAAAGIMAAGGGLCCYRCNTTRLTNVVFKGNHAASFGGGAALLRPAALAAVDVCDFEDNTAARAPPPSRRRSRRRLLATAARCGDGDGIDGGGGRGGGTCLGDPDAGYQLGNWATTVDVTNTTADDGLYSGGGGLYASLQGPVELRASRFTGNAAESGGGMVARTDLCLSGNNATAEGEGNGSSCRLSLVGARNTFVCNSADGGGAGGGVLVTQLDGGRVGFSDPSVCGAAELTPDSFRACLGAGLPSPPCGDGGNGGADSSGRRALLQGGAGESGGAAQDGTGATRRSDLEPAPLNAVTPAGYGADVAGAAAAARFEAVDGAPLEGLPLEAAASAAPGNPVAVRLVLQDGLGRNVTGVISDASMLVQATLRHADGRPADVIARAGNVSRAFNGSLQFPALSVLGPAGDYLVDFRPLDARNRVLRPATLRLRLRGCVAGEAAVNESSVDEAYKKITRMAVRCELCKPGSYSVDPALGFCVQCDNRTPADCRGVAAIPLDGYWASHPRSPLVHRCLVDAACMKARPGAAGAMLAWAARHKDLSVRQLNALAPTAASNGSSNSNSGAGASDAPRPLFLEYVSLQCSPGYEGTLCGACAPGWGRRGARCVECARRPAANRAYYFLAVAYLVALVFLAGYVHIRQAERRRRAAVATGAAAFAAAVADGAEPGGGGGGKGGGAAAAADGSKRWGPPEERVPGTDAWSYAGHDTGARGGGGGGDQRGYGDGDDYNGPRESVPGRAFAPPPSAADKAPTAAAAAADDEAAAAGGAGGGWRAWLRGALSTAPIGEPAGTTRYWLSPILKQLVTHLQLLGLLRGLRVAWPRALAGSLLALDQASTVTPWVSLDCSLGADGGGGARRSARRTLAVLLLPLAGLALGAAFWGAHRLVAGALARRRPALRRLTWARYYRPRAALTAVLVFFYLYPQVSNAVVSIFSCARLDADLAPSAATRAGEVARHFAALPREDSPLAASARAGYWAEDTAYTCYAGAHRWLAALGGAWMAWFCLGFPLATAAALWRQQRRARRRRGAKGTGGNGTADANNNSAPADIPESIELSFGFLYGSYAPRFYFWESVVLLEKLALALAVTLLQRRSAATQALAALAVVAAAAALQAALRPMGCARLHALARASLLALQATLFLLLAASIEELATPRLATGAVVAAGLLNLAVIAAFAAAFFAEARRMLRAAAGKRKGERLTLRDVRGALAGRPPAAAAQAAPQPAPAALGPPVERLPGGYDRV